MMLSTVITIALCVQGTVLAYEATSPPSGRLQSVCYPMVGCFNNKFPFNNTDQTLPNPPELVGTEFWLYTRASRTNTTMDILSYSDDGVSIKGSKYDSNKPLKVVIHGFSQDGNEGWVQEMKEALLTLGDMNVIVVSWGPGAALPDYLQAVANTRMVATQLTLILQILQQQRNLNMRDLHIIGHSLGAHIAGYTGASFNGHIGRISGMDPAEPNYQYLDVAVRLNKQDAIFVDVLHSNGAPIYQGGAGLFQPSGHVDFYPNGGKSQPGCPSLIGGLFDSILNGGGFTAIGNLASCSHARSHRLYLESILSEPNKCTFRSFPCSSYEAFKQGKCFTCSGSGCSEMGYHANEHAGRGNQYLATASTPSYCGDTYLMSITTQAGDDPDTPIKGNITVILEGSKGKFTFPLKGRLDTLGYGEVAEPVVISSHIGDVSKVTIDYEYYEGLLFGWNAGVKSFTVTNLALERGQEKHKSCSQAVVNTGKRVSLKMC